MLSKLIKCKNKYYDKNGEQPLTCIYHLRIQLKTFDRVCYGGLLNVLLYKRNMCYVYPNQTC